MASKKFLFLLFFVPSTISFLRLFRITIIPPSSSPLPPSLTLPNPCSFVNLTTRKHLLRAPHKLTHYHTSHEEGNLTTKEHQLLSNIISQRAPCNLLFFGLIPQFLTIATLNTKGTTIFLEDDEEKLKRVNPETKGLSIYKVKYHKKASEAYELLKHGREHFGCKLEAIQILPETGCKLALTGLPKEVYKRKWDVVVIDGPRGDRPEAPGRMGAIYTAAVIARATNATDVFVHDIDRMVEKWYSWEFLCHENLVSSKGKLWHFRIDGNSRSSSFCPEAKFQIK